MRGLGKMPSTKGRDERVNGHQYLFVQSYCHEVFTIMYFLINSKDVEYLGVPVIYLANCSCWCHDSVHGEALTTQVPSGSRCG